MGKNEEFRKRLTFIEEFQDEYDVPQKYSSGGFMPHLPKTICVSSKPKKNRYEEEQGILEEYNKIYRDNGIELD